MLDQASCAAGDSVSGSVAGGTPVTLLRVERGPQHEREFQVATSSAADDTFTLAIPETALPTTTGDRCSLVYSVRGGGRRAELRVDAGARPHVDTNSLRADRLLAGWAARHFHLELAEAGLEGGGRLAGRVHRHGAWPAGEIVVQARCVECWRSTGLADYGMPQWHVSSLWQQSEPLRIDPDATWAGFGFDLPDGLPRAVEASTIAWRYELLAQRTVRHWFTETAALTPLLYEA